MAGGPAGALNDAHAPGSLQSSTTNVHPKELVEARRRYLREKRGKPLPTPEDLQDTNIGAHLSIDSLREMGTQRL